MKTLTILALLILTPLGYCSIAYPDYTYRYRMTVEVDTPDGLKTGSSVIEVKTTQWPAWISPSGSRVASRKASGEAPFVDLGERGILFTATMGSYTVGFIQAPIIVGVESQRLRLYQLMQRSHSVIF